MEGKGNCSAPGGGGGGGEDINPNVNFQCCTKGAIILHFWCNIEIPTEFYRNRNSNCLPCVRVTAYKCEG